MREWDRSSGKELRRFEGHSDLVWACAYSLTERFVLSSSRDATIKIWERESPRCVHTTFGAAPFYGLCISTGHVAAGDELGNLWMLQLDWLE